MAATNKLLIIILLLAMLSTMAHAASCDSKDQNCTNITQVSGNYQVSNGATSQTISNGFDSNALTIPDSPDYTNSFLGINNAIKISHIITSEPESDISYSFAYTGNILVNMSWYSFSNLSEDGYNLTNGYYNVTSLDTPFLMFDDGFVFDFTDLENTTESFDYMTVNSTTIDLFFKVANSGTYPYTLDPTFGNGTIQSCQGNASNYCNITVSSAITGTDFVLTNYGTSFGSNVTITLSHSRILWNSSEYFIGNPAPTFVFSGETGGGANGGSGPSASVDTSGPSGRNGATNGATGTVFNDGTGCTVNIGVGSGLSPFEFIAGAAGTQSGTSATGGGFYASGGVTAEGSFPICAGAISGGSGQSVKIYSANIFWNGTLNDNGGAGNVFSGDISVTSEAAGGGGAGEVLLYGAFINNTGTITLNGGPGSSAGGFTASNGAGGEFKECNKIAGGYSNTGSITLTGSPAGTSTLEQNTTCYPDVIVNPYTNNDSNFANTTPKLQFNVGDFNASSNVSCWMNEMQGASTTILPLGMYNFSTFVSTYNVSSNFPSGGLYNVSFTCGNVTGNIANVTSSSILINISGITLTLNAPANNSYQNVSLVNFNWTTSGVASLYLSNLSIDGIVNVSNIVTTNATATNQTVNNFVQGQHNWFVQSSNGTLTNTSLMQIFTVDLTPPIITLNSPLLYTNQTTDTFNFTAIAPYSPTLNCSLLFDGSVTSSNATTLNSTPTLLTATGVTEGVHFYNITCISLSGNSNISSTGNITNDYTNPSVVFFVPANGSIFATPNVTFSFMSNDTLSSPTNCGLYLNGMLNSTNASVINNTVTNFSEMLPDGIYTWSVNCIDLAGNQNSTGNQTLTIITTPPMITLQSPPNGTSTGNTLITFVFNTSDTIQTTYPCTFSLSGIGNQTNNSVMNGSTSSININGLGLGTYYWNVSCMDIVGNVGLSPTFSFTITTPTPGGGSTTAPAGSSCATTCGDGETQVPFPDCTCLAAPEMGSNSTNLTIVPVTPPPMTPPPVLTPSIAPPASEDPGYYTNPPPGPTGLSPPADAIVTATKGAIQQLPYQCPLNLADSFNFIGAGFIDNIVCSATGIFSLYVNNHPYINTTVIFLIILFFAAVFSSTLFSPQKAGITQQGIGFYISTVLFIIVLGFGFDFATFALTAIYLIATGVNVTGVTMNGTVG